MRRRLAAIVALLVGTATVVLGVVESVNQFPRGLGLLACVVIAAAAAWYGILRRGIARVVGLVVAGAALAGALILLAAGGRFGVDLLVVVGLLITLAAVRASFAVHVDLPRVAAPKHPVLFYNPLSGGGKAERFALAKEARARGIEPIELKRGDDLEILVRGAVERGADGLAMAGGDGSQAIVAAIAAEKSLPYACIPAGTRNHFALDLGVDRDDVVGALDAFVDGGERRVDLAEVNGRVFVNNVSLGVYAEAVQRDEYRGAKMRTLLDTVPDALGAGGSQLDMRWTGPGGHGHRGGAAVLVSNNRYRLGRAVGSGTRPRIDDGLLGITVMGAPTDGAEGRRGQRPLREWSAPSFEVESDRPLPAGVDGEALVLDAPLQFRIRPGVLRVRIAHQHPGSSPSAMAPEGLRASVVELVRIAFGVERKSAQPTPERP
ncbi:diacylglycerol/lipid kinase family protein [Kribbella sp. NPDC049174]|uniref:diacylglycerol/lipid kinase family protein n=1 Tax=Kribbella sp. NPDC049174 TaxID=3364112 RepID=UPI0037124A15